MALQLSVTARDNALDSIETTIGTSAKLYLFSGTVPANCAASDPSGLLATLSLPSDWMSNAASGSKALLGTWSGSGSGTGTAQSFRIKDSTGTTCHLQGTVTITGSGGDMTVDNPSIATGQTINVTGFTITDANS
jgi:hypothetical protein